MERTRFIWCAESIWSSRLPAHYAAVSVSLSFCLSTSLQTRRPECLCMGFITGSCRRAPLTSHVFPSGDRVVCSASGRHMCRGDRGGRGRRCGDEWQLQGQLRAWLPAQTAMLGTISILTEFNRIQLDRPPFNLSIRPSVCPSIHPSMILSSS